MLFPKYDEIKPSGEYKFGYIVENYTYESRVEEFLNDGSKREFKKT